MAKGGASAARLHGKLAGSRPRRCTGKARGPRFDRTVIPPRKRKRQAKPRPEHARAKPKGPRRANPCISIVFLEPRKTGACGAEARMHGLGTLTRGTQRILATSPLRCGLSHKENRRRQRRPGADGARRSKGTPTPTQTKQPPGRWGKARGGNRVPGKGTRNAAYKNRPRPMGPGADIAAYWREGNRQHTAIDRAPLGAKRMHKGRLPFESVTSR